MNPFQIYAFADEASPEIDAQITAMKRNGLQGLEMRMVDGVNVSEITKEKALEVKQKLTDAGLITWSMGSPIGKIDIETGDFAAECDKLRRTLELADILGAKNIRMFSFYMPEGKDPASFRTSVMDKLASFAEIAQGTGIDLCHENEKGIFGDVASRCLDVLQTVPQLKGVFDPANFVQVGQDTLEAWKMLKPYIKYMHIKDALSDGNVVPAGKGEGNVAAILAEYLNGVGTGMTVEPHLMSFASLKSLEREGEETKLGTFVYKDNDESFDAACNALKSILVK